MQYTNNLGLSTAVYDAVVSFAKEYDKVGWKSVTTLCDAPRPQILQERHAEEIVEDVSDLLWSFFGNMGHLIAERSAGKDVIAEQRFTQVVDGKEISFKCDRVEKNIGTYPLTWTLRDFKVTSVFILKAAYKGTVKIEWERQMNLYVYLLGLLGFNVTNIKLEIIGRDWRLNEQLASPHDYPPNQCIVMDVPIWPVEKQEAYIMERIKLFKESENLSDAELPKCSQDERWAVPDRYTVVQKKGPVSKQTGFRTPVYKGGWFKSHTEAMKFIESRRVPKKPASKNPRPETLEKAKKAAEELANSLEVEFRKGESKRCERGYCSVARFCNQYREEINPVF